MVPVLSQRNLEAISAVWPTHRPSSVIALFFPKQHEHFGMILIKYSGYESLDLSSRNPLEWDE